MAKEKKLSVEKKMKVEGVTLNKSMIEETKDELIYVKITPQMRADLDKLCEKMGVKSRAKIIRALITESLSKVKVVA